MKLTDMEIGKKGSNEGGSLVMSKYNRGFKM